MESTFEAQKNLEKTGGHALGRQKFWGAPSMVCIMYCYMAVS